jgi:hypothetical protein
MKTMLATPASLAIDNIERLIALRDERMEKSPSPAFYPKGAIWFAKASISTQLCNLIDSDLKTAASQGKNSTEVFVIGNDGSYFEVGDEIWKKSILSWTDNGNTRIKYLLLSPLPTVVKKIATFVQNAKRPDLIEFCTLMPDAKLPEVVKGLKRHWQTHHFVLGYDPKFLWMEANHPANSKEAYDCAYLNSTVCESSPDWEICRNAVETAKPYLRPLAV